MYKDNKLIASAKTDSNGNYKIKAVHGNYQLAIAFTGYKYFTSNVSVVTNRTTYVENVLLVEDTDAQGTATGKITNALTGTNIEGVTMQIRSGWNVTEGEIVKTIQSNNQGMYSVTLPVGYYTVSMSKDGYVASVLNIYISKNTAENQNGVMNPIGSTDTYRIVLQWGENPGDLDSHVIGKLSNQSNFHVYYNNRNVMDGNSKVASLGVDDTNGFGNETITLIPTTDAPYSYYVYKYAGTGELIDSNAQVKLYKGNQLIKVYNVPVTGSGRYWNVFTLTNEQMQDVNLISNDAMRQ